jgi:sugar lactone lactonase YvrE
MNRFYARIAGLICLLTCLFYTPVNAQQTVQEWYKEARDAHEQQDWETFLKASYAADSLRPNHPTLTYNLAAAYARNGLNKKAADVLMQRMTFYADSAFFSDPDFESFRNSYHFGRVKRALPRFLKTVSHGELAFRLSNINVHAEGLVWSEYLNAFLISDIRQGLILQVTSDHKRMRPLFALPDWNYWSAMGMAQDPTDSKYLWIVSSALPEFADYQESEDGKAALLKIDLEQQELVQAYTVEGNHVFGDLTVASNGTVYVSDSRDPIIYRLPPDSDDLTEFITSEQWWNLQGMAISVNNGTLWVSDYLTGVYEIDVASGRIQPFYFQNSELRGTDGMYRIGNRLALIQNGTKPKRITKVNINHPEYRPVFLDAGIEALSEPTLGTVRFGKLYYIANSAWGLYDRDGNPQIARWPDIEIRVLDFN